MALNPKDQQRMLSLLPTAIPAETARNLDSEELGDRLTEAARLLERSRMATSPTVAKALGEQAQAVLKAQPRQQTATEIRELMTKSARAVTPAERDRWRAAAERVKEAHPMAPRRHPPAIISKSGKDDAAVVACYDETGTLVGTAPREKIQPVAPISRDAIVKAQAAKRRSAR